MSFVSVSESAGIGRRGRLDWAAKVGPGRGEGARVFQLAGRVVLKGVVDMVRDADQARRGSLGSLAGIMGVRGRVRGNELVIRSGPATARYGRLL